MGVAGRKIIHTRSRSSCVRDLVLCRRAECFKFCSKTAGGRVGVVVHAALSPCFCNILTDCLDNGNHKKALQEAEKLLKKQKDFSCAKALKALALVRLSRSDEALSLLRELQVEAPTDDATLQAMTLCYREMERPELIVEAYERATQKEPSNEELLSHLFMGYVRVGRPREQRHTALALHRLRHKNPYYFWAVMSLALEAALPGTPPSDRSTLLLLAQRMVDKFAREGRIEAEAGASLFSPPPPPPVFLPTSSSPSNPSSYSS
ncbi:hypothetical protein HPB48_006299 [Haemaphysalis longicornis]|uniref:N-terminal acetyltransferase B complex subunit NAA25 homolog n=1 Tax=Haemaphysalis longicornis TaxID=44386 RepID=A0A9J6GRW6_HAELO|nr:hypothetical protein HPB48_006299 [Haemaphysalis longicornis]